MKSKLIIRFALVFLVLLSCTKQIDDSILDVDIEELLVEVDPILSTQNTISSVDDVYLNGDVVESFDYEIIESDKFIRIVLPSGSNVSSVSIDFTMAENASLASSISGLNFTGTGIKLISVVAENGDTRTYALKIIVTGGVDPMPSPSEIISVTSVTASGIVVIPIEPAMFSDNSINVLLPAGTPLTDISFEFEITENSFLLDDATNLSFESGATNGVRLESEEGVVRTYTITVELENTPDLSDENDITKITATIGDAPNTTIIYEREAPGFDGSRAIIMEVPFKTAISDVDLEFELSEFATLQIDDITTGLDFTGGVVKMFTVIAQDGSEQTYGIGVVIADPTEREALIEMYNGPDGIEEEFQWDLSEDSDIGLWHGVSVNADGNVIGITTDPDVTRMITLDEHLKYLPFLETISGSDSGLNTPTNEQMEGVFLENLTVISYEDEGPVWRIELETDWIFNQTNLEFLRFQNAGDINLMNISNLTNLKTLAINQTDLESIPASIADLPNLTTLNISDNSLLTSIPQAICDWGEIDGHTLLKDDTAVCDGGIVSINEQREALVRMYDPTSNLWDITDFTADWAGIDFDIEGNVIGFNFSDERNPIKLIDENLKYLPFLERIHAFESVLELSNGEQMSEIVLPELTSLSFQANSAVELHTWLINQPNLNSINLLDPSFELPENIGIASELTTFTIEGYPYESLPDSFADLSKLTTLNIYSTLFTDFQTQILSLSSLETLLINNNDNITSIPELLLNLEFIKTLDILDNENLTSIPQVICDWGEEAGNTLLKDDTVVCGAISDINEFATFELINDLGEVVSNSTVISDTAVGGIDLTIEVPFTADITNLSIQFTLVDPVNSEVLNFVAGTTYNFEEPQTFVVSAQNGDQRDYDVVITRTGISEKQALFNMYQLYGGRISNTADEWNLDDDITDWQGVTTEIINGEVHVTGLSMDFGFQPILTLDENLNYLPYFKEIKAIDTSFRFPNSFEEYDIENSNIETIFFEMVSFNFPQWIINLPKLKVLYLDDSFGAAVGIPNNIGDLPVIEELTFRLAGLDNTSIPSSISNLNNTLKKLILIDNNFTAIPDEVLGLSNLESLIMWQNFLTEIPETLIEDLPNLNTLDVSQQDGNLTSIPKEICDWGEETGNTLIKSTSTTCQTYPAEIQAQRDALLSMYDASRDNEGDWASEDWNDWSGITIENDNVVAINWNDIEEEYLVVNENLGALKYLREIHIEYQKLPLTIVTESGEQVFPFLESVNNDEAQQSEIPQWVFNSTSLKFLEMEVGTFTEIEDIGSLINLETLIIDGANLTSIPESIGNLQNLQTLEILYNESLQSLPNSIGNLINLTNLDLSNNSLTALPSSIGNLTSLQTLRLSSNNFTTLPSSIGNLVNLESLYIQRNDNIVNLPIELWQLSDLSTLSIGGNSLAEFSSQIENMANLNTLSLESHDFSNLPEEIANLTNLKTLRYSGRYNERDLEEVPAEIFTITSLTTLSISYVNNLKSIPSTIGNLFNLESLDVQRNIIENLPPEVGDLVSLQSLNVSYNDPFTELPDELEHLIELNELTMDNTSITIVEREVCEIVEGNGGILRMNFGSTCQ